MTVAVLKGLLESVTDQVNMVNAPVLAKQRGIKVVESKSSTSRDFVSAISVRVRGVLDRLIVGAVFQGGQPRIVRIDQFMLEAIPEGPTLLLHNHDQPGVVGKVGTILGEEGLNISRMQLALAPDGSEAAMLVNISVAPKPEALERLRALPQVISAQFLDLA
jgi:D-3-phosphoglycerate dehydrogenase